MLDFQYFTPLFTHHVKTEEEFEISLSIILTADSPDDVQQLKYQLNNRNGKGGSKNMELNSSRELYGETSTSFGDIHRAKVIKIRIRTHVIVIISTKRILVLSFPS